MKQDVLKIEQEALDIAYKVHNRIRKLARCLASDGYDPTMVMHSMMTESCAGLIELQGRRHTLIALLQCYQPIKHDLLAEAEQAGTTARMQ